MSSKRVGRRFRPSDEFLISVLEWKTKKGNKFDLSATTEVPGALVEMGMYGPGKEPWKIFSGDQEIWELHETCDLQKKIREKYVVTKLKPIGRKNYSRSAGDGLWLDKSKKKPVYVRGQEVGHWRTLTYEYSGAEEGKSYYYMNELHLSKPSDYVVCRVLKHLTKDCRVKRGSKRLRQGGGDRRPAKKRSCQGGIVRRPAKKRSRREETPESSSCSEFAYDDDESEEEEDEEEIVSEEMDDDDEFEVKQEMDDDEFTSEQIYHDEVEVKEESIPVDDPNIFGCEPELMSIPVQQEQVDSFDSASVYVPDMLGVEQYQQQQVESEFWGYPEIIESCSSTFPEQGASQDQWLEELMKSMGQEIF